MRSMCILFGTLSLLSLISALPGYEPPKDNCLPPNIGSQIASEFLSLVGIDAGTFDVALANSLIADDFVDTSDSINYLAGIPLGGPTFSSKAAFIAGAGSQAPMHFTLLNVDGVSCNGVIAFRWVTFPGSGQLEAKGINIIYTVNGGDLNSIGPGGWQVSRVFTEFNSAAWIVDIGGTCPPPPPPSRLFA